ncbi:MAG: hypothetical protein WCJ35_07065 [Planctomycetota bacterium]
MSQPNYNTAADIYDGWRDDGKEYKVDPVNDLRPVCANCHAILHRLKPAYSIDEVKAFRQSVSR